MLTLMKMKMMSGFRRDQRASVVVQLRRLRKDERGAVSIMMGFLIVPLVGFLALGFEVSNWYSVTRGMQNAADAATLAAAFNNGSNYDVEARAVAATYGFVNGTNNVAIEVTNTATCPLTPGQVTPDQNCYSVHDFRLYAVASVPGRRLPGQWQRQWLAPETVERGRDRETQLARGYLCAGPRRQRHEPGYPNQRRADRQLERLQLAVVYRRSVQWTQSGNWHQLYGRIQQRLRR